MNKCKAIMFQGYSDVLEVKDIMKALKIGRHTVYGLIKCGKLKSFKIGKAYKVTKNSLINYVNILNRGH